VCVCGSHSVCFTQHTTHSTHTPHHCCRCMHIWCISVHITTHHFCICMQFHAHTVCRNAACMDGVAHTHHTYSTLIIPTCTPHISAHLLIILLCPLAYYALMPTCSLCSYAHLFIMLLCPLVIMPLCPLAHCALMPTCSPHFHHTHFAHLCTTFTPHSLCSYAHLHTTHCAHLHTTLTPHSPCSNAHLLHTHCAHLHTTLTPHSPCSDAHSLIMLLCPLAHHTYSTPIMLSCPLAHHNIIIMPTCTPQLHHHAHLHTTTTSLCPLAHHNYMYYTGLCIVAHCLSAVHNQCNALTCTHHPPHKYTYSA
jgi:hypothetical protein